MRSFLRGLWAPRRGWAILKSHPALCPWALAPFSLTMFFVFGAIALGWVYLDSITAFLLESRSFYESLSAWKSSMLAEDSFWTFFPSTLLWILKFFFQILSLFAVTILGYLLSMIFTGTLWEFHVEVTAKKLGLSLELERKKHWTLRYAQSLSREAIKAAVLIFIPLFLMVLGWIPFMGLIFSLFLLPLTTAFLLGFSIVDYAMNVEERPLRRRLRWSKENVFYLLGAGAILSVPVLGVFVLPFSITAVTEMYAKSWQAEQEL